jgi:hypothetical protein
MKTLFTIALFFFSAQLLNAQVGIGTTSPDASAQIDITNAHKGMLPPRVALTGTTDVSTIASPATGLVVYNTTATSDVVAGYYFYNGSAWMRLVTGIKTAIEADNVPLTASSSGNIYYSQNAGSPIVPENLPDGFTCEIINYSNYPNALTTLSTVYYYNKTTGWNGGVGVNTVTIVTGGSIRLTALTVLGIKCYFVTGDLQ